MTTSKLLRRFEELSASSDVAVTDEVGSATFADIAASARALAARLRREGLGGQRLGLLTPQDRSWLEGFWAVLLAGGSVVPLSPLHPTREHEFFLRESRAAALVVAERSSETIPAFRHVAFGSGSRAHESSLTAAPPAASTSWADAAPVTPEAAEDGTALMLYTSGTTGKPKGVPISHGNVFEGVRTLREAWAISPADRVLHVLPLHHVHGICVSLLCAFLSGARTHMLPRYDAQRVLEAASLASVLMGVPTQHAKLVQCFDALPESDLKRRYQADLRGLRLITSGSAALPEKLGRRIEALSGQYPLERYGMTEVGIVLGNPLSGPRVPGSCGQPLPRCQIRIVDDAGRDVRSGQPGEIWISAPSVFRGYDGDDAATRAAFTDGFFRSGDTAIWLDDGFVKILGRTSVDIIKSGGYKLSALEIEEHLREHPWVSDVAVLGVPDETWGERVLAVVVPAPAPDRHGSDEASGEALREWMKQRVAAYKVPKQILFRMDLPRNAMGKVQKSQLLAQLSASES